MVQVFKGGKHFSGALIPLIGIGPHGLGNNRRHSGADVPVRDGGHFFRVLVRADASQKMIQRRPQTIDVRAHIQQAPPFSACTARAVRRLLTV